MGLSGARISVLQSVTDNHCFIGRISFLLFFCHFFSAKRDPSQSLQRRAASVQFQMDSDGMSLLQPHPSLGTSPLFRGCWQNLSLRHPREYFMWRTLTGRKQDMSVGLSSPILLQPAWRAVIFCPFKRHKVRLSVAPQQLLNDAGLVLFFGCITAVM